MDIFGTVSKMMGGGDAEHGGSLAAISPLIQGQGGLGGLVEKLKGAGLGGQG